ncbi:MAG: hypothetical protein H7321_09280 [Bacteroidia bacterium]|nr:hypothetical protein [Bacteroidia bacterium]
MTIKIIVVSSNLPAIKAGIIYNWNGTLADAQPPAAVVAGDPPIAAADKKVSVKAIVVMGNPVYKNGTKLNLWISPNTLTHIFNHPKSNYYAI